MYLGTENVYFLLKKKTVDFFVYLFIPNTVV